MAIEIHLPDIGADSADVTEILVNVGDAIEVDSPLISVEGDKAAMEVPSPKAGTVTEIKVAVGDSISTGTLVLMLDPAEGDAPAVEPESTAEEKKPAEPVIVAKEVSLPDVGTDNPRHGAGGRARNAHARARGRPAKAAHRNCRSDIARPSPRSAGSGGNDSYCYQSAPQS